MFNLTLICYCNQKEEKLISETENFRPKQTDDGQFWMKTIKVYRRYLSTIQNLDVTNKLFIVPINWEDSYTELCHLNGKFWNGMFTRPNVHLDLDIQLSINSGKIFFYFYSSFITNTVAKVIFHYYKKKYVQHKTSRNAF